MDETWFCYMLSCCDGSFYVGITTDAGRRVQEHQKGRGVEQTAKRLPVKLVWSEELSSRSAARIREMEIKGWSRRKKMALIGSYPSSPAQGSPPAGVKGRRLNG